MPKKDGICLSNMEDFESVITTVQELLRGQPQWIESYNGYARKLKEYPFKPLRNYGS